VSSDDIDSDDIAGIALLLAVAYLIRRRQLQGAGTVLNQAFGTGAGTYGAGGYGYTPGGTAPIGGQVGGHTLTSEGEVFIKDQEGFTSNRQPDAGHTVIGYGHDIVAGDQIPSVITRAQAQTIFAGDMAAVENVVNGAVSVPLTDNQFTALASLVFNIGAAAFQGSTLLQLLNAGDYAGAQAQFAVWNRSGGAINQSLVARRAREAALFSG
jgi:lysozyme